MAKGKKSRPKYTSKNERPSVARQHRVTADPMDTTINKQEAFLSGKKVYFTIDNPNPNDTRARKIRVEGKLLYGDYRKFNEYHVIK